MINSLKLLFLLILLGMLAVTTVASFDRGGTSWRSERGVDDSSDPSFDRLGAPARAGADGTAGG